MCGERRASSGAGYNVAYHIAAALGLGFHGGNAVGVNFLFE
jgi:hypothetical protein